MTTMMEHPAPTSGHSPKVGIIRHLNIFTAFALGALTAIVVWRLSLSLLPADSESAPLFTREDKITLLSMIGWFVGFMTGIVGQFFKSFALTIAFAVGLAHLDLLRRDDVANTLVAVYFYDAIPTPAAPSGLTVSTGPYTTGSTITVSWPTYGQCPTGFALKSYVVTANGGTVASGGTFGPTVTSTTIVIDSDTSEVRVSYLVKCGSLSSNPSEDLVVPVD